jgi:hypothetical protein
MLRPVPKRLRLVLIILGLMIGIGLILGALWATNALGWRRWRIQEAQAFIGADLPTEATNIQFATADEHTRIVWLRFDLPAGADVDSWLAAFTGDQPLLDGFNPFPQPNPQEAALTWWTPHGASAFSGFYRVSTTQVIEALLDQSDAVRWIVYLRVYNLA